MTLINTKLLWINCLKDFLTMPYFKNYHVDGLASSFDIHEKAIEHKLFENGFKKEHVSYNKQSVKKWLIDPRNCSLSIGCFAYQPCGTQNKPDFLIRVSEYILLALEAKSSRGTVPMYNSGGIIPDYIYIFSSEYCNKTTLYFGRDIINKEQQNIINKLIKDQKKLEIEANKKLKELNSLSRGVGYYTPPTITQTGSSRYMNYMNYINHINRDRCDESVLTYFENLVNRNIPKEIAALIARANFLSVDTSEISIEDVSKTSLGIDGWANQHPDFNILQHLENSENTLESNSENTI